MATSDITRYESGLGRNLQNYQSMMSEMQAAKTQAAKPVASEYQQNVDIYKPGGTYGQGAYDRIRTAEQQGIAASSAGLARSGMSSGSLAAGVRSRYGREAETQMKEVEDTRNQQLGNALQNLGAAQSARGLQMQNVYAQAASLFAGWKEPTVAEYGSAQEQALLEGSISERLAGVQGEWNLKGIAAQGEQNIASQTLQGEYGLKNIQATGEVNEKLANISGQWNQLGIAAQGEINKALQTLQGEFGLKNISAQGDISKQLANIQGEWNKLSIEQQGKINEALAKIQGDYGIKNTLTQGNVNKELTKMQTAASLENTRLQGQYALSGQQMQINANRQAATAANEEARYVAEQTAETASELAEQKSKYNTGNSSSPIM